MSPARKFWRAARRGLAAVCLLALAKGAAAAGEPWPVALETSGRVLAREGEQGRYRGRVTEGMELRAGDAVLTGPGARVEWRVGAEGRWRVGERAVWIAGATPGDADLLAGTALAAVPRGAAWKVGAADARILLGEGAWLLTAVENEGLKIVALDEGDIAAEGAAGAPEKARLRAGEVVFARPGGRGFGPVVTIFLDELLATSRLLTRFSSELPRMERLRQQGTAQRERLALVSNLHVGGAKDAEGFQVMTPGSGSAGAK